MSPIGVRLLIQDRYVNALMRVFSSHFFLTQL